MIKSFHFLSSLLQKSGDIFNLQKIPLITPGLAEEIIRYRRKSGRIFSLNELLALDGFNHRLLEAISLFVKLSDNGPNSYGNKSQAEKSKVKL